MLDIGSEVRQWRLDSSLTQDDAADLLNVSKSKVSKVENNRMDISAREYFRWQEILKGAKRVASLGMIFNRK